VESTAQSVCCSACLLPVEDDAIAYGEGQHVEDVMQGVLGVLSIQQAATL
jgi:hypothetical protein